MTTATPVPEQFTEELKLATAACDAVGSRVAQLGDQIAATQSQIDQLTRSHDAACRALAGGDQKADPVAIKTQLDLVRMKLSGLQSLRSEAIAQHGPLADEMNAAWSRVRMEQEVAKVAELTTTVENRNRALEVAKSALQVAQQGVFSAVAELENYRNQLDQAQERRRRGQER